MDKKEQKRSKKGAIHFEKGAISLVLKEKDIIRDF